MSATSASSLLLPSLKPKALSLSNPRPISFSLFSLSHRLHAKPLFCSALQRFELLTKKSPSYSPSKFVRNVAVSSEFGQEEDVFGSDDEEAPSFSPDLKLFVGNLPFSVGNAQLAGLFGSAGNVQMVEEFEGRALRVNSGPPPPRREEFSSRGTRGAATMGASNRVYAGNLSWGVDDSALETLFSEQGQVVEVKVVYGRESGRSRGFGFVTHNSTEEVDGAIKSLNSVLS